MNVFPKWARDAIEPTGQALAVLGGCMFLIAIGVFLYKTCILYSWPRTTGVVVNSRLQTTNSDDGTLLCGAVYSVQYSVNGQNIVTQDGGHTFTGDCTRLKTDIETAPGKTRVVIYDGRSPSTAYIDAGFNIEFHQIAFVLTILAGSFGLGGWIGIKVGRWVRRNSAYLP